MGIIKNNELTVTLRRCHMSTYFDITPPEEYSFLDFYKHQSKQTDFTFSFRKESYLPKKDLHKLLKNGSETMKKVANRLDDSYKAKFLFSFFIVFFTLLAGLREAEQDFNGYSTRWSSTILCYLYCMLRLQ